MAFINIPPSIYTNMGKAFSIIFFIMTITIAIYHVWTANKSKKAKMPVSIFLSFISFAIAIILETQLILEIFDPFSTPYCEIIRVTLPALYSLWKLSIYIIFPLRIHEAFGESFLAHGISILSFYGIIFTLWSIFNIIYGVISNHTMDAENDELQCQVITDNFLIVSTVLLDATAGIIYTYLFILPFQVMERQLGLSPSDLKKFRRTAFKQFILSISAIISTMCAMVGFAIFSMPEFFITLDVNISSMCIILMYSWNAYLLSKICFCCMPAYIPKGHGLQSSVTGQIENGGRAITVKSGSSNYTVDLESPTPGVEELAPFSPLSIISHSGNADKQEESMTNFAENNMDKYVE